MKLKIFYLLAIFSIQHSMAQTLYVGGYTKGDSQGIYKLDFNTKTGALSNKTLVAKIENPSFICLSKNKKKLYAAAREKEHNVSAFKVKKDGSLNFLNRLTSHGRGPCHVTINKKGNRVVVSNYGGGTVAIYSTEKDGKLKETSQVFNHNTKEQKSHVHSALFFKNDLFVADLGRNAIYNYHLDHTSTYKLKFNTLVKTTGNPGPRHFKLTKNGKYVYVINEYAGSITSIKKTKNGFTQIDYDTTLRKDFKGKNTCADIHISKDERFIYGSNRGENTIAVFKRSTKDGTLEKIQSISTHGNWPRNFTLDPTGRFLLVANQKSNTISIFSIHKNTGKLTYLNSTAIASPTCLIF